MTRDTGEGVIRRFRRWLCAVLSGGEHRFRSVRREGYRLPDSMFSRSVAVRVRQSQKRCWLCGHQTEWKEKRTTHIHSLSMPSAMWDELYDEGEVWF